MLTLHTTAISANGRKPLAVAKHLGLNVDVRTVNVYLGEGQAAEYRELNPMGKVPTLVDETFVLWESNAILIYLAESQAACALWSRDPQQRANVLRWMFWESSHWQPVLARVLAPRAAQILMARTGEAPAHVAWADVELCATLNLLESALARRPFVCGGELSLADFSIAGMTTYFRATGFPGESFPAISAWLRRMDAIPAWQATWAEPWASG